MLAAAPIKQFVSIPCAGRADTQICHSFKTAHLNEESFTFSRRVSFKNLSIAAVRNA